MPYITVTDPTIVVPTSNIKVTNRSSRYQPRDFDPDKVQVYGRQLSTSQPEIRVWIPRKPNNLFRRFNLTIVVDDHATYHSTIRWRGMRFAEIPYQGRWLTINVFVDGKHYQEFCNPEAL